MAANTVKVLVEQKAAVDRPMSNGWTPLMFACALGHVATAGALLEIAMGKGQDETLQAMPLTVVVFGATGDLAKKKLFPALYQLCLLGYLLAFGATVPGLHAVCWMLPVGAKWPGLVGVHSAALVRSVAFVYEPSLQGSGALAPAGQYCSSGRSKMGR